MIVGAYHGDEENACLSGSDHDMFVRDASDQACSF